MVVIYKGEDTTFANLRQIAFTLQSDQITLTGWTGRFFFMGVDKCLTSAQIEAKSFTIEYTTDETRDFPLGMNYGTLHLYDADGKHATTVKVQIDVRFNPCTCGISTVNQIKVNANNVFVDYNQCANKAKINGVTVEGDKTSADYGILSVDGLNAEIARAMAAEAALGTRIDNEAATRASADSVNAAAIAAEKSRAEGVEASLASSVNLRVKLADLKSAISDPKDVKLAPAAIKEYLKAVYNAIQAIA